MRDAKICCLSHPCTALCICPTSLSNIPSELSGFLCNNGSINAPFIKKSNIDIGEREVTFLWHSESMPQAVYVRLNRVTDKENVEKGMMISIPSTNAWTLSLKLPATYRGSYSFIEIPSGTTCEEICKLGGRFASIPGQPDPYNSTNVIDLRGFRESILSLDRAPPQIEWEETPCTDLGVITTSYPCIAGYKRRVRVYFPDVSNSSYLGLLVLPDAETWFDRMGITRAIDIAIKNGRIAPMAILGIDNRSESDRVNILGGNKDLILETASTLIPQLYKDYPQISWAGRSNTVIAGQSLGGLTALLAALNAPEIFGTVISHSPSMWWSPDRSTPAMLTDNVRCWISEQLANAPPRGINFQLAVGSLEGATVHHVQQLHQSLIASGVESTLTVYAGGHDYAWWRGALIDALADMHR